MAKIWRQYDAFKPLIALSAVCSKAVVLLLMLHCLMFLLLFVGGSVFGALLSVLSSFAIVLTRKRELAALLHI